MPCVYLIQNKVDKTIYVGKANNFSKRWYNHKHNYIKGVKSCPYLYNAFNKYGIDNFDISILEEFTTAAEALEAEIFWIGYFRLIGAQLYNLTLGGEAGRAAGFTTNESTKNLIGKANSKIAFKKKRDFENDFGHLE